MQLLYEKKDEDIMFLFYTYVLGCKYEKSDKTVLCLSDEESYCNIEEIVIKLIELAAETISFNNFMACRKSQRKENFPSSKLLASLNYFNVLRKMLQDGSFENLKWLVETAEKLSLKSKLDPEFMVMSLQLGTITEIKQVENSDNLYNETVEFSDCCPVTICSNLVKIFKPEDLLHKTCLFFNNIKPVKFLNTFSNGMIAIAKDEFQFELITGSKGEYLKLENSCDVLYDERKGKFGCKKPAFQSLINKFSIKEGYLLFKDRKCLIDNKHVQTLRISEGSIN